jgi:carbonic anhydrase
MNQDWRVGDMDMTRRTAMTAMAGVMSCACCATARAASDKAAWSYEGATGPEAWGDLAEDFQACSTGMEQSPINLVNPIPSTIDAPKFAWTSGTAEVINNGHTIQANVAPGSTIRIGGKTYEMLQFHFHHPSEHLLDGKADPLEVHFVHQSAAGDLAVIGVLFRDGAENPALNAVWDVMPESKDAPAGQATVSPMDFLPADPAQFRYAGSLTTPPCSEVVHWIC